MPEEEVVLKAPPVDPGGTEQPFYKYKYNGQEWQDELSLNLFDMDMRDYDPAIGRWTGIDPVTHFDMSPYNGMDNNPIYFADPSGADGVGMGGESINTWHYAGTSSFNSFLNGGAGNFGFGDHMLGGSGNSFWMGQGAVTGGEQSNPFSLSGNNLSINWNRLPNGTTKWNLASDNVYLWHEPSVTYNGEYTLEDGGRLDSVNTGYWEKIFGKPSSGLSYMLTTGELFWYGMAEKAQYSGNVVAAGKYSSVAKGFGPVTQAYAVYTIGHQLNDPTVSTYDITKTSVSFGAGIAVGAYSGGFAGALAGLFVDMSFAAAESAKALWNQHIYAISNFTLNFRGHVR